MGRDVDGRLRQGTRTASGRVLLETSEISFRGEERLRIPLAEITKLEARDGWLHVAWADERAAFELGAGVAEDWLRRIQNPRGLMDKLGVKADSRVALVDLDDAGVRAELEARVGRLPARASLRERDVILFGVSAPRELRRLVALREALQPAGALWVIWPKGRKQLREDDVRAAARAAGLVDVKVASVSDALSGLKLVIPVKDRKPKERA